MDSSCADKPESRMGSGRVGEDNLIIFQYFCRNKSFLQKNSLLKTASLNFEIIIPFFTAQYYHPKFIKRLWSGKNKREKERYFVLTI